jgi:hypothetical protein
MQMNVAIVQITRGINNNEDFLIQAIDVAPTKIGESHSHLKLAYAHIRVFSV